MGASDRHSWKGGCFKLVEGHKTSSGERKRNKQLWEAGSLGWENGKAGETPGLGVSLGHGCPEPPIPSSGTSWVTGSHERIYSRGMPWPQGEYCMDGDHSGVEAADSDPAAGLAEAEGEVRGGFIWKT